MFMRYMWILLSLVFFSLPSGYSNDFFMVTSKSEEAEDLLKSADQYAQKKDWERAVGEYHKIMEEHPDKLIEQGNGLYVNAYRVVLSKLNNLPKEGKEIYQKMMEIKVLRLTEETGQNLEKLAQQYIFSPLGEKALVELIDKYLNEENYERVLLLIHNYLRYDLGNTELQGGMLARLGLCYFAMGDQRNLESLVRSPKVKKIQKKITLGGKKVSLSTYLKTYLQKIDERASALEAKSSWPMVGKEVTRSYSLRESFPIFEKNWSSNIQRAKRKRKIPRHFFNEQPRMEEGPSTFYPTIADNTVFINNGQGVYAYDLLSRKEKWHFRGLIAELKSEEHKQLIHSTMYHGGAVYANVEGPTPNQREERWQVYKIQTVLAERGLVKLDARTGQVLWYVGNDVKDEEAFENKACFVSPPTIWGDQLYVGANDLTGIFNSYVVSLDPDTGKINWKTLIGSAQQEQNLFGRQVREVVGAEITLGNGQIYYSSNLGAFTCVNPVHGQMEWLYVYNRISVATPNSPIFSTPYRDTGWFNCPSVLYGGNIYFAPVDSNYLYCLDAHTGKLQWKISRGRNRYLLGVSHGKVMVGYSQIEFFDAKTGKKINTPVGRSIGGTIRGLGCFVGNYYYCPIGSSIQCFDLEKLRLAQTMPLRGAYPQAGHLAISDSIAVMASNRYLSVYYQLFTLEKAYQQQISVNPNNVVPYLKLANLYSQKKHLWEKSQGFYLKVIELSEKKGNVHDQSYIDEAKGGLLQVYQKLAEQAELRGKVEQAAKYYEKALPLAEGESSLSIKILFRLYETFQRLGKSSKVEEMLKLLEYKYGEEYYSPPGSERKIPLTFYVRILLADYYRIQGDALSAVENYQSIILEYPRAVYLGKNGLQIGYERIEHLLSRYGREVYSSYEKQAQRMYDLRRPSSYGDLATISERYPNSTLVNKIILELAELLLLQEKAEKAVEHLRAYIRLYNPKQNSQEKDKKNLVQAHYWLLLSYEKLDTLHAARSILEQMSSLYNDQWISTQEGTQVLVQEFVKAKLKEERYKKVRYVLQKTLNLWSGNEPKKNFRLSSQKFLHILPVSGNVLPRYENLAFLSLDNTVFCYEGKSATLKWKTEVTDVARGIGFIDKNLILWDTKHIFSINPKNGKVRWRVQVRNRFADLQLGSNAIGVVRYENAGESTIEIREPESGKVRWSSSIESREVAEIIMGEKAIVAYTGVSPARLVVYDLDNGRFLFNYQGKLRHELSRTYFNPLILPGGYLCFALENRWVECYRLPSMEKLWSYDAKKLGAYSMWGNEYYVCFLYQDRNLISLDLLSGGIKWKWSIPPYSRIHHAIPGWDTFHFVEGKRDRTQEFNLWSLSAKDGMLKWKTVLTPENNQSNIKLDSSKKYILSMNNVWRDAWKASLSIFDRENGKLLKFHEVKKGDRGRLPADMQIVAEDLWIVKDNQIWIMGK